MQLSAQQSAVVQWVQEGSGSAIVRARAGTGKTTLLLSAMQHMKGRVACVAYNKKIASEVAAKAERAGHRHVVCGTFHKFGFDAWRLSNRGVQIEERKKFTQLCDDLSVPDHFRSFVRAASSLAKQRGFGVLCRLNDPQQWLDLVDHFDLDMELAEQGFSDRDFIIKEGCRYACKVVSHGIQLAPKLIDFDDMLYMPLQAGCRMPDYDWVLVDEAQDTNPVRRAMARRMLKPGGRAIFVGDDRQAIYGFTGADNDSLDLIARDFGTREFPLTVTYRCPKAVVAMAQQIVPDYTASDEAPEGVTRCITDDAFIDGSASLTPADAVICRNTRPLVSTAFALIKRGITCHVEGREIGAGLLRLADRWPSVKQLPALLTRLGEHREREVAKLMAKGKEQQADALADKVDTLIVIAQALPPKSTVADLRERVNSMFADTPSGQRAPGVTLMTAHRSKGLEFSRVFIWGRQRFMPSRFARQDWQLMQEANLEYVALTRSMGELVDVEVTRD